MRYKIKHNGETVAESLYADLAEAAAKHAPVNVFVVDEWSGKELPIDYEPQERHTLVGPSNPYGLPFSTIDSLIMNQQKIMAIKLIRELTGFGLGESKAIADRRSQLDNPTRFR